MLGLRSPFHVVTSLTMLGLSLFAVTTARAQTPKDAVDKPIVEASTPASELPAKTDAAPPILSADPVKPAAQATPTPPPCPAGTRLVKADVVAIPKAIMLNRLGATIPNAFIFALKRDTSGSGLNLQLRP